MFSGTRWLTRVDSIDCLLKNFLQVCEAFEECSSSQSVSDADSYLKRLLTFECLASAVICQFGFRPGSST